MTREDALKVLTVLKAAYPASYRGITRRDAEAILTLWAVQFENESAEEVQAAVTAMISTRKEAYTPTIGEIKDQLHKLRTADQISEAQAWALVERACSRGLYNSREEYEKLPPEVQAAVGGSEQLKAWAMMDAETVNSVVASNFRRAYRTVQTREKEKAMLPDSVKAFLTGVAGRMLLTDSSEKKERGIQPIALQPMTAEPREERLEPPREKKTDYHPPDPEEWERKRAEAMEMLRKA